MEPKEARNQIEKLEKSSHPIKLVIRREGFEISTEGAISDIYKELNNLKTLTNAVSEKLGIKEVAKEVSEASIKPVLPEVAVTPKTLPEKFLKLREDNFFKDPKDSGKVVEELRNRGWGVYVSKDISSSLKKAAPKLRLRRVPLGKRRYGYVFP